MTLADAIRKGAMQRAQCFKMLFEEGPGVMLRSCALGAAVEGYAGAHDLEAIKAFGLEFTPTLSRMVRCPACAKRPRESTTLIITHLNDVHYIITHLNDVHHMSREQIADWLDTLEVPSSTPDAAPPAERGEA